MVVLRCYGFSMVIVLFQEVHIGEVASDPVQEPRGPGGALQEQASIPVNLGLLQRW